MNSNLHRQLAKILHTKTGITLSSFLCAPLDDLTSKRSFKLLASEDIDPETVGHWLIQCAEENQGAGLRVNAMTVGMVFCSYRDAINTALCMDPVYQAHLNHIRAIHQGKEPGRDSWIAIVPVDSAIASQDAIELSLLESQGRRTVLFFDEWLATKYEVPNDQKRNFVDDVQSHVNVAVYGPSNASVVLLHNEHTDDISIQYGNLYFADNIERDVEAVAYKVYLCLRQEISEDDLAEFFDRPMHKRKLP